MDIRSVKALGLAVALGLTGFSAQTSVADEGRFYIAPGIQWMDFDSDRGGDDDTGYSVGLGYGLTDNWAAEFNFASIKFDGLVGRDRLRSYRLDALYSLDNSIGSFSPYFVGGIGHNEFRRTGEDTNLNVGAGLNYRINDNVAWRTAARTYYGFDNHTYDFGIDTAVVFYLGSGADSARVEPSPAPSSPAPVAIVDSDGDGVPDDRDECPNTPRNYAVDDRGCPILIEEVSRIELAVQFEFDADEVRPQFYDDIRRVADFLNENDDVIATLEGHTCNMGDADYNQQLSERRANAVRQTLIDRFNVSPSRIRATGFGEAQPVASNDTVEGRQRNRRVESSMSTTVQRPQLRN